MDTHTRAPFHTPFRVNRLRDLGLLHQRLLSGAESKPLCSMSIFLPPDLTVIYGPRERQARVPRGRRPQSKGDKGWPRARPVRPSDVSPAPATRGKLARTYLLRGFFQKCLVKAFVKVSVFTCAGRAPALGPDRRRISELLESNLGKQNQSWTVGAPEAPCSLSKANY